MGHIHCIWYAMTIKTFIILYHKTVCTGKGSNMHMHSLCQIYNTPHIHMADSLINLNHCGAGDMCTSLISGNGCKTALNISLHIDTCAHSDTYHQLSVRNITKKKCSFTDCVTLARFSSRAAVIKHGCDVCSICTTNSSRL